MRKDDSLHGKNLIVINSGGKKKRFTLEIAKKLGINIILVNHKLDCPKRLIEHFIQADTFSYREVIEKIELFRESRPEVELDGAITFWEDDIPVLGHVCEYFDFSGNSYQTAINTRNKYEMRKRFDETGLGTPDFYLIKNPDDLDPAIAQVRFPAVMKPVWGSDSEFVVLVRDEDEAQATYQYLLENCNEQFNPIFKYNSSLFLYEEYVEGTEVSVECFAQFGIPHVIGINEKQPINPPYFIEYGDIAPARLSENDEAQVKKLSESALIALGVKNSLSHIEIKVTPQGPKLIEVASRMGGDDIYLNVRTVWGEDMVKIGLQIALGQKVDFKPREAKETVICRYFIPSASGVVTNISGLKNSKANRNVLDLILSKDVGDSVFVPPEGFENLGWVITRGNTYQEAQTHLEKVSKNLQINVTPYHKGSSLGKTIRKDSLSSASLTRSQIMRAARIEKIRRIDLDAVKRLHIGLFTNTQIPLLDASLIPSKLGEEISRVLNEIDYNVSLFDMSEVPVPIRKIQEAKLDLVLNLCEAMHNSTLLESHAAALLDILQLPYTGSGSKTISLCLDKIVVKKMFDYHDIPTPKWDYIYDMKDEVRADLQFPLIVKPANTDNSFGITNQSVVTNHQELQAQLSLIVNGYNRPALIEEFIEGDEFDICLIGNKDDVQILPLIRSIFDGMPAGYWHIYGSDARGDNKSSVYDHIRLERPARISPALTQLMTEISLDVFNLFELQDYGKIEFRVDKNGNPYVLEVNPNPPLGRDDFLALSAAVEGYSYEDLIEEIIYVAVQRYKEKVFYYLPGDDARNIPEDEGTVDAVKEQHSKQ